MYVYLAFMCLLYEETVSTAVKTLFCWQFGICRRVAKIILYRNCLGSTLLCSSSLIHGDAGSTDLYRIQAYQTCFLVDALLPIVIWDSKSCFLLWHTLYYSVKMWNTTACISFFRMAADVQNVSTWRFTVALNSCIFACDTHAERSS